MLLKVAVVDARSSRRRGLKGASKSWLDCCWPVLAAGSCGADCSSSISHSSLQPGWPSPSGLSRHPFHPNYYSPTCTTTPGTSTGIYHGFQKHMYSLSAYSDTPCCPPYYPTCSTPPDFRIFRLETILETSPDPPVCPTESCTRCRLATPARK